MTEEIHNIIERLIIIEDNHLSMRELIAELIEIRNLLNIEIEVTSNELIDSLLN